MHLVEVPHIGHHQTQLTPNPSHHRLHLKLIDPKTKTVRDDVFKVIFGKLEAPLTRLNTTETGYYAIADDIRTIDKLLTNIRTIEIRTIDKLLAKINLQPSIPPDMRAKRTIFIRQVDMTVGRRTPEEIKTEIIRLQTWAKIQDVIKIKEYTHVFKLVCKRL